MINFILQGGDNLGSSQAVDHGAVNSDLCTSSSAESEVINERFSFITTFFFCVGILYDDDSFASSFTRSILLVNNISYVVLQGCRIEDCGQGTYVNKTQRVRLQLIVNGFFFLAR